MINYSQIFSEVAGSSIQIAAVSNGSFAHAKQITGYITSGYDSVNKIRTSASWNETCPELVRLSESATLLVTSMFFSQVAGAIHDVLEIRSGIADLMAGREKDAITKLSFSALSLTAQLTLNIHAKVALIAVTILFDLVGSIDSFRNGRYIEGVGTLVCAAIRFKKSEDVFEKYKQIWSKAQLERRVAVDVGSGSTKVIIADVDTSNNRIVNIIYQDSIPVAYQKDLEDSENGDFSSEIQKKGIDTFNKVKELANQYQADRVCAVATAAFRASNNGKIFAQQVTESTGIPLRIISQYDEGVLAYESVSDAPELESKRYVCWDIGTGSFQITSPDEKNKYAVYMTKTGSVPFKNYIIDTVKGEDSRRVDSPNPLYKNAIKKADSYARWIGRHALPTVKSSVRSEMGNIVGIGRLFQNSLLPLAKGKEITRKDLRTYIRYAEGKTDDELNNPFAKVDVSNAILALGVMKALHIHNISVFESTSTRGMLAHEDYWKDFV